jgi:hypothetical protein
MPDLRADAADAGSRTLPVGGWCAVPADRLRTLRVRLMQEQRFLRVFLALAAVLLLALLAFALR